MSFCPILEPQFRIWDTVWDTNPRPPKGKTKTNTELQISTVADTARQRNWIRAVPWGHPKRVRAPLSTLPLALPLLSTSLSALSSSALHFPQHSPSSALPFQHSPSALPFFSPLPPSSAFPLSTPP